MCVVITFSSLGGHKPGMIANRDRSADEGKRNVSCPRSPREFDLAS